MKIGLTGTYCAGKNYIAGLLEKRGLPVLDVDKAGHAAIETEKKPILERFGNDILDSEGKIDRKLLGKKVFGNPAELAALEEIVHPAANRLAEAWIREQNGPCVINAALLHRSPFFDELDAVIIVRASFLTRLLRAKKRDRLSWRDLLKRFGSQKKFTSQYLLKKADIYRVENPDCFGFIGVLFRGMQFRRTRNQKKLEGRIDEILSCLGL